ncbi:hypothetical protein F5Y14DRAFT_405887 [Nemania sp. NC0429]|nr:hypothetical protein F5Y14DRAFT_405887 [Nemania sp. NC0429]
MFFEGSLQDGISTALQQAKQVVCFITDDGTESQEWENKFLTDDAIRPELASQSIVLRLPAGSEEAGYLEALFPVPKKPTIVVIQNGQLKEYIAAGTSKEEFIRRLGKTNQPSSSQSQSTSSPAATTTPEATPAHQSHQGAASQPPRSNDGPYSDIQPTASSTSSSSPTQGTGQTTPTEDPKREKKNKGKARAEPEVETKKGAPNPEQAHANEVKQRKHHENEERRRILKRIEDDKRARKEREAAERRARALLSGGPVSGDADAASESIALPQRLPTTTPGHGEHCNLQVRLLDGSTVRKRFASGGTLAADVRGWIDEARTDGDAPYAFRVVLTPQPNRVVAPQEEGETLLALGLAPSATLVLVPTPYSIAYARAGGVLAPLARVVSSLCGAIMASVGGFFALFFGGGGGSGGRQGHELGHGHGHAGDDEIPMENLRSRRRGDSQLYNGNSLNFEPRNEEDDNDDDRGHGR